ncbi:hypothetical protein [Marinobacter salsuginis]|uniref:hypothetical protein n=1 Tax=Marinobacter salsuginis TaxID=418719 RepID=UPI00273ECCA3|nr:hypothetical protein [Marinobacter salsuginis]
MRLRWRDRLKQNPKLYDFCTWPELDPALVPDSLRRRYLRNRRIVQSVLAGGSITNTAAQEGLSPGRVTQLMNRCLGGDEERAPALLRALVPHQVIAGTHANASPRGQFARLMADVPGLRAGLDQMLLNRLKDRPSATVVSPNSYHSEFKRLLATAGWPLDDYPYTTNSMAYESVRRDLYARWTLLCQAQKSRRRSFTELPYDSEDRWLFDRIEIDEQTIDCESSSGAIDLVLTDRLPPLRLSRPTVLIAVDVATDCILGFQLSLKGAANQDDLLMLLHKCVQPGSPQALRTEGLALSPNAGFPNLQGFLPLPRSVAMDNAWMHHAASVEAFISQELNATLSFSRVRTPTVRRTVETAFNRLNHLLSHRFASTTGSSVTDPKKESRKNRKRPPVLSLAQLEDALYVTFAEMNTRPRPNLNAATPLTVVSHQAEQAFLATVNEEDRESWNPFKVTVERKVHDVSAPSRRPYVNIEFLKYKGPGLLAVPGTEPTVMVQYDRRDIRQIEIFRLNGQSLGHAFCPGSWRSYPHGTATRRYLFKHCRELLRKSPDPLVDFLALQREQIRAPSDVAAFLKTYQEFCGGFGLPTSLWHPPKADKSTPDVSITNPEKAAVAQKGKPSSTGKRFWSIKLNPGGPR